MHVSINIPFTNAKDLATILESLQKELKMNVGVEISAAPEGLVEAAKVAAPTPKVETKSKKKAAPTQTQVVPAINVLPETPVEAVKQITKSEATSALQVLNNKKGLPAARIILAKFKTEKDVVVQRLSELKESDYPKFYELCMAETEA